MKLCVHLSPRHWLELTLSGPPHAEVWFYRVGLYDGPVLLFRHIYAVRRGEGLPVTEAKVHRGIATMRAAIYNPHSPAPLFDYPRSLPRRAH
jgi:hypothetical protein